MATKTTMTLDEFLALPEEPPYAEYVDGEVIPKPMPTDAHGTLVIELGRMLGNYLYGKDLARIGTEVRHISLPERRIYLPDVAIALHASRSPVPTNPVEIAPDLAVEVLSPDDRPGPVSEKVDFYLRNGVEVVWVVDPENESVTVYRRGERPLVLGGSDVIDAAPVLSGFTVPVEAVFAVLHEGQGR